MEEWLGGGPESPHDVYCPETAESAEEGRWDPFSFLGLGNFWGLGNPVASTGDDTEKRSLREQVAALQQEVAALRESTSTTVASNTVKTASDTVETEGVRRVALRDTRECVCVHPWQGGGSDLFL